MRALLACLLLAGCLGSPAPAGGAENATDPCADTGADCPGGPTRSAPEGGVVAPDLPLGRAWTYAVASFYEPAFTEMTVVVASKDDAGYLFAGATPDDLGPEAVWGRGWHGERDRGLVGNGWRWIDFPLVDGKTWDLVEGFPLVARAADVRTPTGTEEGFVIDGAKEDERGSRTFHAEYAPSLGAATVTVFETSSGYYERLEMTGVSETSTYAWFELGPRAECEGYADDPPVTLAEATPLELPEGHDALLVSAGGVGGRGAVASPAGERWTGEGGAAESWTTATLPATPGNWALACAGAPDGWYFLAAQAVTWTEGTIAPEG